MKLLPKDTFGCLNVIKVLKHEKPINKNCVVILIPIDKPGFYEFLASSVIKVLFNLYKFILRVFFSNFSIVFYVI